MSSRRLATTGLLALCALGGALGLTSSPASAGFIHRYLSQIKEVPAEPGVVGGPFSRILGVASDSGNLYAVDEGSFVVDEFNSSGGFLKQISGEGIFGGTANSVAVSHATGEVYVAEFGVVDVFSAAGALLASWKGEDTPGGSFSRQTYVAVDNSTNPASDPAAGDVYVSSVGSQKVVDVLKPEPGGKEKYLTQLTGTPSGAFGKPASLGVDETTGDVLVVDGENGVNAVDVFKPKPSHEYEFLFRLTGPPGKPFGRDKREIEKKGAGELEVEGVAADSNGDIYVVSNDRKAVYEFTSTGEYVGEVSGTPSGAFNYPIGVAVGSTGDLYVADASIFEPSAQAVDVFGPNIPIPDVSSAAPSVAAGVVTLNGTVNPSGAPVTVCKFEYGTTSGYGSTAPCSPAPGSGTSPVAVATTRTWRRSRRAPSTTTGWW